MKKLLGLILLVLSISVYSQTWTVSPLSFNGVAGVQFSGSNIDSVNLVSGAGSTTIDWSILGTGGNTMYWAASLDGVSTTDTVQVIMQGYDAITGNYVNIDTLSTGLVSTAAGTTTSVGTVSLSSYFPVVRVLVKQKSTNTDPSDDEVFKLSIFAVPPTLPDRSYWK